MNKKVFWGVSDISCRRILAFLTLPVILFCSGSAASICYQELTQPLILFACCTWTLVFISTNPRLMLSQPGTLVLFILILGAVLGFAASGMSGSSSLITFLSGLLVAYIMVRTLGARFVLYAYLKVMVLLAAVSLIGFALFEIAGIHPPFPTMQTHTGSTIYANGLLFCVDLIMNNGRNIGIFWEPSIFAAYLNIAISILLFYPNIKLRNWGLLILSMTLLSTESAGGLIEFLCILVAYWFYRGNRPLVIISVITLVAAVILMMPQIEALLLNINHDLFYKFFGGADSGTTLTRLECPLFNLQIWLKSPIFGHGFYGADLLYNELRIASSISNLAQTSTVTYFLAAMGLCGIALPAAFIFGFAKLNYLPRLSRVLLFVASMIFLNEEPCTYFVAMYMLLFVLLERDETTAVAKMKPNVMKNIEDSLISAA